tara:strand:+ start:122 stop:499 length:378 start_codon:yes stop_codon:yes gene_type:complete
MKYILLILVITFTGCSTIASKTQQLTVTSSPDDALITINGHASGKGYAFTEVYRDRAVSIMVSKKGCQSSHRAIGNHVNGLGILDGIGTIFFLIPAVGLATAGAYSLDYDTLHFTLICNNKENEL